MTKVAWAGESQHAAGTPEWRFYYSIGVTLDKSLDFSGPITERYETINFMICLTVYTIIQLIHMPL